MLVCTKIKCNYVCSGWKIEEEETRKVEEEEEIVYMRLSNLCMFFEGKLLEDYQKAIKFRAPPCVFLKGKFSDKLLSFFVCVWYGEL